MDVALLNVKITFQKNSVEVDAIGNHKNGWTDYYTCHATVSGESGNEKHTAGTTVEDNVPVNAHSLKSALICFHTRTKGEKSV